MSGSDRTPLIAGNWKMHATLDEARALAHSVARDAVDIGDREVAVLPPACFLDTVLQVLGDAPVAVGAQNLHPEPEGAYTGEIAGPMLASLGVRYVLCGHSERRHVFGESSEWIGRKVAAAHRDGLTPILCVGETMEQRDAHDTEGVLAAQLDDGMAFVSGEQVRRTVIAYEPVWAIGTGRTATPDQAQSAHAFIRAHIGRRIDPTIGETVRIVYGGSVKPANASDLLGQSDVDGALVGGASLKAGDFASIIRS